MEDDGLGCSDEALKQLAKRGARLDETQEGYGLGLAIAREIVHAYHGQILFGRSKDLGGFQVMLELPI